MSSRSSTTTTTNHSQASTKEDGERNLSLNIPTVNTHNAPCSPTMDHPTTTTTTLSEKKSSSSSSSHGVSSSMNDRPNNIRDIMEWSVEQVQSFLESKHFPQSMLQAFGTEKIDGLSLYYLWMYSNQSLSMDDGFMNHHGRGSCMDLQLKLNDRLNIGTLHDLVHLKHELDLLFRVVVDHPNDAMDHHGVSAPSTTTLLGKSLPHISVPPPQQHHDETMSQHLTSQHHHHHHSGGTMYHHSHPHHHFLTRHPHHLHSSHSGSSTNILGNKSPTTTTALLQASSSHHSPSHKTPTSPSMPPPSPLLLHTLAETPVYTPTPLSKKILSSLPPSIPQLIKQILPSEIKILDEYSPGESWGSMITKVIVSFSYLMLSVFCTSVTMVVVHERVSRSDIICNGGYKSLFHQHVLNCQLTQCFFNYKILIIIIENFSPLSIGTTRLSSST